MANNKEFDDQHADKSSVDEMDIQKNMREQEELENSTDNLAEEAEVNTAVQKTEMELAELKDKYLRLYSDFENYKRRSAKERLDLISTANENLIQGLIPVLDDFERSLQIFENNTEVAPMYEGIQLIHGKFLKTLEQKGLKLMEVAVGDEFDSEFHEAVAQTPAPEEKLKNKIVDVIEKGYFLGDKVIRFAKVVTGS